jgi:hypothetical protein
MILRAGLDAIRGPVFDYGLNDSGYTYGTQVGLNKGLIQQGDTTIERLVDAIHASRDGAMDTTPS